MTWINVKILSSSDEGNMCSPNSKFGNQLDTETSGLSLKMPFSFYWQLAGGYNQGIIGIIVMVSKQDF